MSAVRTLLYLPLWTLQVFWMSKSFKANPVLGSKILNRLGLHVARLVIAHAITRMRTLMLSPLVDKHHRAAFRRDGFILIEDFLDPSHFEDLNRQVRSANGEVRECIQGDTLTHRLLLDQAALAKLPACRTLIDNPVYSRLHTYCGARIKQPLIYIQSIKNGFRDGGGDPQKNLHSDTFHPTLKSWLFLEDVGEQEGPFTYVPGSHRLTLARLKWEYRRSLQARSLNDGYSEKGSMRADAADLETMGLPHPRAFTVRKNTLVLADTHGFHCRGPARDGASRLEIWAYSRTNPFNPLPGLNLKAFSRLEYRLARIYWERKDRQAAKRGTQSSWHLVSDDQLPKPFSEPPKAAQTLSG